MPSYRVKEPVKVEGRRRRVGEILVLALTVAAELVRRGLVEEVEAGPPGLPGPLPPQEGCGGCQAELREARAELASVQEKADALLLEAVGRIEAAVAQRNAARARVAELEAGAAEVATVHEELGQARARIAELEAGAAQPDPPPKAGKADKTAKADKADKGT